LTGQQLTASACVVKMPSQILKLQPVVAAVYGGGATSAVVHRGNELAAGDAVRVTPETTTTAEVPLVASGWTCLLTSRSSPSGIKHVAPQRRRDWKLPFSAESLSMEPRGGGSGVALLYSDDQETWQKPLPPRRG
jgi:hypothetical protein